MPVLPQSFPLSAFVGRIVSTVVEAPYEVQMVLTGDRGKGWIHFEGPAVFHSPHGTELRVENDMLLPGNGLFQALCGSAIERVTRLSQASCKFEFSNGYALSLLGSETGYESYHLGVEGDFCDV
jgi:hypothetical protein